MLRQWLTHAPMRSPAVFFDGTDAPPPEINADHPEVQKLIQAAVGNVEETWKGKNKGLLDDLKKVQPLRDQVNKLGGEEGLTKLFELQQRLQNDEMTRLLAEGKTEEWLNRQTDAMRREHENVIKGRDTKIGEHEKTIGTLTEKLSQLTIDGSVREAAGELKMIPSAVTDAILLARTVFSLDEHGHPVMKNEDGTVKLGKDGKTPITPNEWLSSLKEAKGHWFPAPGGLGTPNLPGKGGMTAEQLAGLPPTERMRLAREAGARR